MGGVCWLCYIVVHPQCGCACASGDFVCLIKYLCCDMYLRPFLIILINYTIILYLYHNMLLYIAE